MPLPELDPGLADDRPDVTIAWGGLPERLEGAIDLEPLMQVARTVFQFNAPAGRYRVCDGARILVDPVPGVAARDIRLYLLGTTLAALCHQRALLPLHATAVSVSGTAFAFLGPSGAGKSTLAAQFQRRGETVLADDLCVVGFEHDQTPWVRPGLSRIKLWKDSLGLADLPRSGLRRIGGGVAKYSVPISRTFVRAEAPLRRVYILRPDTPEGTGIRRLAGPEAVSQILENIYRWPLAIAMGQAAKAFAQVATLAKACEIFELGVVHDPAEPRKLLEMVDRHDLA